MRKCQKSEKLNYKWEDYKRPQKRKIKVLKTQKLQNLSSITLPHETNKLFKNNHQKSKELRIKFKKSIVGHLCHLYLRERPVIRLKPDIHQ